jgi:hypothetical protein
MINYPMRLSGPYVLPDAPDHSFLTLVLNRDTVRPNHQNQPGRGSSRAMRAIFISYRRNDSEGEAGRLFGDLVEQFGEDSVFMDVTTIEAGRDFRKVIDESVATCGALLAIIGKNWVDAKDDTGRRRLDDPTDFVRLETASALRRDIPVIPVIVRGATMPHPDQLPDDLKDLAYRNFVELTHARWTSDIQLLIAALRKHLGLQPSKPEHAITEDPEPVDNAETATGQPAGAAAGGGIIKPPPREKKKWWLIPAIAVGVVLAAILGYLFVPRQVTVPNLRGKTLDDAKASLESLHLKVGQTTSREDANKEPNIVLSQYPPSDEQVKRGKEVDLVISEAVTQVEIPPLTGLSLEAAKNSLAEHHLVLGDVERQSRVGVARDTVLQEFPQPGEMVKSASKVDLLVSDVPPEPTGTPTPSNATTAKHADEAWESQRAAQRAAKKAAALKAAADKAAADKLAADKAAADNAAADKTAADKAAADKAATDKVAADTADKSAAERARPHVTIRVANCTTVKAGQYKIDLAGDAYAPAGDTDLFYVWVAEGNNGTRWRPVCRSWSIPQSGEDPLWDVTCIHRPGDPSQTTWETSRMITSKDKQPPTNGGTAIFKMGANTSSTLKFSFSCQ